MTRAVFPLGLPQKHLVPYGDRYQDTTITTPMETGRAKKRERFTDASRFVPAAFVLSPSEWELLRDFYKENKCLEWDWIDPHDGVTPVICRFSSQPDPQRITPDLYQVGFEYEILPE